MLPTGISPSLVRFLTTAAPDLMTELFTPGKVLEADVVSVFQDKAILSFGRGVRLEVTLQAPLQEGQRVRVQVQPQEAAPAPGQPQTATPRQPAGPQPAPGQAAGQPLPTPAQGQVYSPSLIRQPAMGQPTPTNAQPAGQPAQAQPAVQQPQPQPGVAPQAQPAAPAQPGVQPQSQPQVQVQSQTPAPAPQQQGQVPQPAQQQGLAQQAAAPQAQPRGQAPLPARPAPIVLKVIGPAPAPAQAPAAETQATGAARASAGTTAASTVRDVAAAAQPAPVANQPAPQQPGAPQVLWLPIPLPDGNQGWAQIHVQEDDSPKTRAQKGGPVQQVRIWWETPALGPVQVSLEAAATNLAALFTAAAADSKGALDQSLHELQSRLAQVGFPDARVGCRTAPPGEAVEPARIEGANRLDKRL
ncbi:MAG TPA: flagellar hook-length control protein FliK [Symbiobacteriaceae bacterium]|nr:flagellar hook-length control protein FliK [Symbiobacteriaceae bacterium]